MKAALALAGEPREAPVRFSITHIITRMIRGGADENTLLSCNHQARLGHEVRLICGREYSTAILERLDPAVSVEVLSSLVRELDPRRDLRAVLDLTRSLRSTRPHVVHTHTSKAGIIGRVAARLAGVPAIVHGVHIQPFLNVGRLQRLAYLGAERAVAAVTDAFVDVSEGIRDAGLAHRVGRPDRHVVIPSGMDLDRFVDAQPVAAGEIQAAFARPTPMPEDGQLLVMVAALEVRKRVLEFLDVMATIHSHRPNVFLVVLGEGNERGRILDRAEALGMADRVALLGYRDDVERWIAAADVCVFASEREGLPRAVVQYVLAGRPVVATALPGIERVVRHGISGLLVPPDRLPLMAPAIERLLDHPRVAASFRQAALALDLSSWSVDRMVDQLDDVYAHVLTGKAVAVS